MIGISSISKSLLYSLILVVSIGSVMPSGLHSKGMEFCSMKSEMPISTDHSSDEDCPMSNKAENEKPAEDPFCDLYFACACSIANPGLKNEALIVTKPEYTGLVFTSTLTVEEIKVEYHVPHPSNSISLYSSPPLFLVNESFLI